MPRAAAVLVVVSLLGCSSDEVIETTFDPCSGLTIAAGADTTAAELDRVAEAVLAWDAVLPTDVEVTGAPGPAGALQIRFDSGDTFYRALYFDAIGVIRVSREKLDSEDLPLAIAHELGHAFGLFHVDPDERESVMNVGNVEIPPTELDAGEVRALWSSCAAPL